MQVYGLGTQVGTKLGTRMADTRFLEWHGDQWRVTLAVPKDLTAVCKKTRVKVALGTDSRSEANRLKGPVVQAIRDEYVRLRLALASGRNARLDVSRAERLAQSRAAVLTSPSLAHDYRERLQAAADDPEERNRLQEQLAEDCELIAGEPIGTDVDGSPIYDPVREEAADRLHKVALGKETPLRQYEPPFRAQKSLEAKTWGKFEKIMGDLAAYLGERHLPDAVEAVTRKLAGDFINAMLSRHGWKPNTFNAYLSCLRSYWKFMVQRGGAEDNPWSGQGLPKERKAKADTERPFTADEMRKLLGWTPHQPYLADLIRVAALTGARLEALISLRVGDCKGGVFMVPPQKEEPGPRMVPIHSALGAIVARRTEGRGDHERLFPEVPELDPTGSAENRRSNAASKAFNRYRKAVGVDDRREGDRRSKVNFHSFRRWFVTAAHEALAQGAAGFREATISEVVGHKLEGMTAGVYKGAAGLEERRACVEAVELPRNK